MKFSKIAFVLLALSIGVTIFFVVKNESLEIEKGIHMGTGKTLTYHPTKKDWSGKLLMISEKEFERIQHEESIDIVKKGLWPTIAFFLLAIILKVYEEKKDPTLKLKKLKNKSIISQEEYDKKIIELELLKINQEKLQKKEREFKRLVKELDSLKEKGLLTEKEYKDKVQLIREKTGYNT